MDIEKSLRAGTSIRYRQKNSTQELQDDVCLIYPDEANEGCHVAVSKKTSKVGTGENFEEAYVNLIIAIVCAMRHIIKRQLTAEIGVPATGEQWEDDNLNSVHRIDSITQHELLDRVYDELNLQKPDVDLKRNKLFETLVLDLAGIADETVSGFDI